MSHVNTLKLAAELETFEEYAVLEGGEFSQASTYKWYNRHVGDYPLPEGVSKSDLGKCLYKIKFPGIDYEIGIIKNPNGNGYVAIYDFFDRKLSQKIGGEKALVMQEKLVKIQTVNAAKKNKLKWKEVESNKNELRIRTYLK